ncbi:sulfurtransferase TusA family protein [Streptosporangium sp. NPDC000396]|uniref:sulfurtransferase TusA family protein n=1 Tax=Streptosporangium sp. NPDC000396 TaxID=3366185 RepID=UPI0036752C17
MNQTPASPVGSAPDSPLVLDGGERRCVQLLIELRRLTEQAEPGTVIHLIAVDPAAPIDLPAWCHLTGHTYLGPLAASKRPTYALQVHTTPRATHAQAPWRLTD